MAVSSKSISNTRSAGVKDSGRESYGRFRIILGLLILAAAVLVTVFVSLLLYRSFFTANPRFAVRNIEVNGHGYWRENSRMLAKRVALETGGNIFRVDLGDLRKRLEHIPGIAAATAGRKLPDTVVLKIEERIPRALLGNPRSPYVVDEHGVVVLRRESIANKLRLPVISGIPLREFRPGVADKRLMPALELLMTTLRGFPDIRILQISIVSPRRLEFRMTYRGNNFYSVVFPVKRNNNAFLLSALQSAIISARRNGDNRRNFDLFYEGQVVVR